MTRPWIRRRVLSRHDDVSPTASAADTIPAARGPPAPLRGKPSSRSSSRVSRMFPARASEHSEQVRALHRRRPRFKTSQPHLMEAHVPAAPGRVPGGQACGAGRGRALGPGSTARGEQSLPFQTMMALYPPAFDHPIGTRGLPRRCHAVRLLAHPQDGTSVSTRFGSRPYGRSLILPTVDIRRYVRARFPNCHLRSARCGVRNGAPCPR